MLLKAVEILMKYGGDPTLKNFYGFTSLHIAARKGFIEIAKFLLNKGMDPNIRDNHGFSASYWAKENKHKEICEILPPPLKISQEEFYSHMKQMWEVHGAGDAKKKKKGPKKKKK
jgi:hypothetical protein